MIKYIIIHHECPPVIVKGDRFKIVDEYHKSLGWDGIGYNWFIEKSGELKEGRKETVTGAHTIGHNADSIGICLAGNFDLEMPTDAQVETLKKLVTEKMIQYSISIDNVVPHRYYATQTLQGKAPLANDTQWKTWDGCKPYKSCWGSKLSDSWVKDLLKPTVQPVIPTGTPTVHPSKAAILAQIDTLKNLVEKSL